MINSSRKHTEDLRGHTLMMSNVRQSSKTSSNFLPLSIENILGRVDVIKEKRTDDDQDSEMDENKCEKTTNNSNEDDSDVDIEGEEAQNNLGDESKEIHGKQITEKQSPSYTAIIAQAILSSPDKKLPLGNIYEYIAENFPEFLKKGQGWRNCVRHNLSLSECFIKAGRARNGRGNYWGIHPRYLKNFSKGDFRKRRASHRPRNRDLAIGLVPDRLNYSQFLNPFVYQTTHNVTADERSFTVESLLSPERRDHFPYERHSAFNSYKARIKNTDSPPRIPRLYCPMGSSWMEHKQFSENSYHTYTVRENHQPMCSCQLYCCTRA